MKNKDKEIFPIGLSEGRKTKTNYNLVGLIIAGLVIAFLGCLWFSSLLTHILATLFAITIITCFLWVPYMMKRIPASEEYKIGIAELGYAEMDGKLVPIENQHGTIAQNPPLLPPASPKTKKRRKKDTTKQ
ncbi:MAG: hypothetical protein ACOC6R_02610 [Chloroflexota bacterium]